MDELEKLTEPETQEQIKRIRGSYSTSRLMALIHLPSDIYRDLENLAAECGYSDLRPFIEDLCIATVFQWRERKTGEQTATKEGA